MKREVENKRLYLEISTPMKSVFRGFVDSVNVPIEDGMIGILPGHVNTLARILPGILWAKSSDKMLVFFVCEGFMEVANDKVFIISEDAEIADRLDETNLKKEEKDIREKISQSKINSEREALRRSLLLNHLKQKAIQFFKSSTCSTK